MTNVKKHRLNKLMRFKREHINNAIAKYVKIQTDQTDEVILEKVYFVGKLIGTFKYESKTVTFIEEKDSCAADCEKSEQQMNSLPQS